MNLQVIRLRVEKITPILGSKRLLWVLVRYRVLAGTERISVLSQELSTVVDIGANRGQFALSVRQWGPNARMFLI